jgi:glycosyltransferase involved in cell wall biosynthesis
MRVLFVCKRRQGYSGQGYSDWGHGHISSGLTISAMLVSDMLNTIGVASKVVQVVDNNDIDREVHRFKPSHVIIEALWVVPTKFYVLHRLHPHVKWIVRIHSEIPFLAHEGIAMEWLFKYRDMGFIEIGTNSERMRKTLKGLLRTDISFFPNYYPVNISHKEYKKKMHDREIINIGCFGAIRPLKNQLIQAVAAIKYADNHDKFLRFHINVNRIEGRGEGILKNIRYLFYNVRHELVEHPWMDRGEFIKAIKKVDLGMNVSYTETYSVIAADIVAHNVPVVVSSEIGWVSALSQADPNSLDDIVSKIGTAFNMQSLALINKGLLKINSFKSKRTWKKFCSVSW